MLKFEWQIIYVLADNRCQSFLGHLFLLSFLLNQLSKLSFNDVSTPYSCTET